MEALLYSALAGGVTAFGAVIVMLFGSPGDKILSALLGFAAGIMLAISAFDLLPESLNFGGKSFAVTGFLIGVGLMYLVDSLVPHSHVDGSSESTENNQVLRTGYLIFLGIALHNLPEGIAIGAGLEASPELGLYITISIGLHNIPEGMATAGPLHSGGVSSLKTFLLTLSAGMMTPIGTALGLAVFSVSPVLVGTGLAIAAGAMVYIVSDELIPTSHKFHSHLANFGLIAGFVLGFMLTT